MFVVMSIHKPKEGMEVPLIDSMHRFGAAAKTQPGLQRVHSFRDTSSGSLIGLAIWDSAEAEKAARPALMNAIKDDPFDEWEEEDNQLFTMVEV